MNKEESIRVAQIIGKWVGGGVEAVVMNYYRHIDRNKIQFDFICDNDSTDIPYEEIQKLGGRVILIPPYQKIFKYHKQLKKVLKDGNYKIVHSHINMLSVFSLLAAKCAGVPIRIAHNHTTTNKKEWKKNLLKQCLRPFSKVFATDYFCCSELAGRWLFGDKEYDKGNVYLLNNAIDIDKFKFNEEVRKRKRKELGINEDTLVIGHVGRFVESKNHRFLIDIFNEVYKQKNNSKLILIGQGTLEEKIKNKVKKLKLQESVSFLGQKEDVNEWYQAFDIFLFPSLYEGLGMAVVEAQIANCYCIVATSIPTIAKITDNLSFIGLNENIEVWKNEVFECLSIDKKYLKDMEKMRYSIKEEVKFLEEKYKCMLK